MRVVRLSFDRTIAQFLLRPVSHRISSDGVAMTRATTLRFTALMALYGVLVPANIADAQGTGRGGRAGGRGTPVVMDSARARELYVSNRPEDHPQANFEQQVQQRLVAESTTVAKSKGALEYTNVKYKSSVDGM